MHALTLTGGTLSIIVSHGDDAFDLKFDFDDDSDAAADAADAAADDDDDDDDDDDAEGRKILLLLPLIHAIVKAA